MPNKLYGIVGEQYAVVSENANLATNADDVPIVQSKDTPTKKKTRKKSKSTASESDVTRTKSDKQEGKENKKRMTGSKKKKSPDMTDMEASSMKTTGEACGTKKKTTITGEACGTGKKKAGEMPGAAGCTPGKKKRARRRRAMASEGMLTDIDVADDAVDPTNVGGQKTVTIAPKESKTKSKKDKK